VSVIVVLFSVLDDTDKSLRQVLVDRNDIILRSVTVNFSGRRDSAVSIRHGN
jgi:hypothetical protein